MQWIIISLGMGCAVGLISLFLRPGTSIKHSEWRVAYLILAPPFSAWISFALARRLARRGRTWMNPSLHAICAFCFALALTVLRFAYAHRP